ncbi:peptidoglycan recognition family protein [Streptomyces sp. NPDC005438]|uniref:N-acetylmuramoyl-L-alanine amidase n=1 Tax=Streptomyces sp. NPDC005438 TaxID=3156880 RepID=UPI0033A6CACF
MDRRSRSTRKATLAALSGVLIASLAYTGHAAASTDHEATDRSWAQSFDSSAKEYQVPRDLLVAMGYGETRLNDHDGKPSQARGYGVMHLVDNADHKTLGQAAKLTGLSKKELRTDSSANIRGAAAVLDAYAKDLGLSDSARKDVNSWYPAVAKYSGATKDSTARIFADSTYRLLKNGVKAKADGQSITVEGRKVAPKLGRYAKVDKAGVGTRSDDYPPAIWNPASEANYTAGRSAAISQIVIHVTQGSYAGSISWFQNPEAQVSAHYVIRSEDGEVTQMVRDADTAWHARDANSSALGIEHEGYVDDPAWFTESMYASSAKLTKHLLNTHGLAADRNTVVGHSEVPGNDHTDPGPNWDWDHYMDLVNQA